MPGISENLMEIEHLSTDAITEYARNARKNADTVAAVKASIKEFGFQQPIVVDRENVVIVGHARLKAARELGLKTVPVTRADNLTPEQVRAYRLLDNKIAEHSKWDNTLLGLELSELDFDFKPFEVDFTYARMPDAEKDKSDEDAPGEQENPKAIKTVSAAGDVWRCGRHRLICGDSMETYRSGRTDSNFL